MIAELERCFDPAPVPRWFYAFGENSQKAIDDLLFGRFPMDSLNSDEPDHVLMDWADLVGTEGDFLKRLDDALAQWVKDNWGAFPKVSSGRLALAWCRLSDVVAFVEGLDTTAANLLEHFEERGQYLGALSDGPSRDALGRYLFAIARYQKDRRLAAFWWDLCDLRGNTPYYHGRYAVAGLRGLPAPESQRGGFRSDIALALLKVGRALDRLVTERLLSERTAEEFFLSVSSHTVAAYPPQDEWSQLLAHGAENASERILKWLGKTLPSTEKRVRNVARAGRGIRFNPEWPERARQLEIRLKASPQSALHDAEALIAEERAFAEASGEAEGFAATLCALSRGVRRHDQVRAARWAAEAKDWVPGDPRSWTHWIKALELREPSIALDLTWEALERFPENAYLSTQLAHLLIVSHRLGEAKQAALESVERFPLSPHSWGTLATALRGMGEYSEAERVCRDARTRFSANYRWWMDLALALVLQEKTRDAAAELRDAVEKFPNEVFLRNFLGAVLSREGRLSEAEEVLRAAVARFGSADSKISLAGSIRRQGRHRLDEALGIIEEVLKAHRTDVHALAEKARIFEDLGRLEEASLILENARRQYPDFDYRVADPMAQFVATPTSLPTDEVEQSLEDTEGVTSTSPIGEVSVGREEALLSGAASPVQQPARESQEPVLVVPERTSEQTPPTEWAVAPPSQSSLDLEREPVQPAALGRQRIIATALLTKREQWKLDAKTSQARLLRKWARRNEVSNEFPEPAELRRKSGHLLEDVLSRIPNHPRACVERANLMIEAGALREAQRFIEDKIALMPSAHGLRQALARLNREMTRRQGVKFDRDLYATLTRPLLQLQRKNPAMQPLVYLGRGRICFAMNDGLPLRQTAATDFEHLRQYISEEQRYGGFHAWWNEQMRSLLFSVLDPQEVLTLDNVETVERALEDRGQRVDVLEEDFTIRMSR